MKTAGDAGKCLGPRGAAPATDDAPAKKPKDCKVLYTPSAAPRTAAGARREVMLGWLASSTLKPQKKANIKIASPDSGSACAAPYINPSCTSPISAMEAKNTARK